MISGIAAAPPEYVAKTLDALRRSTSGPIGANFIVDGVRDPATSAIDPDFRPVLDAAVSRARVIEYFYADPDPELVEIAHAGGALVSWQVGSAGEAIAAEKAGCDLIVAQGAEAGGHVRGTIGLLPLLAEVLPSVRVPVLAAGGIGTGRGMAAALIAGASGVRVGTRFIAAAEAEPHPRYLEKLMAARAEDTVLTEGFSTDWPNAPHRVLRASLEAMQRTTTDIVGERVPAYAPETRRPIHRGDSVVPMATTTGNIDAMPHWAGESVGAIQRVQPAAEIIRELVEEAERSLRGPPPNPK